MPRTHVTRHTSHVTRHTSHVTRHTSHIPQALLFVLVNKLGDAERKVTPKFTTAFPFRSHPPGRQQRVSRAAQAADDASGNDGGGGQGGHASAVRLEDVSQGEILRSVGCARVCVCVRVCKPTRTQV